MHIPSRKRRQMLAAGLAGATVSSLPGCASVPAAKLPSVTAGRIERLEGLEGLRFEGIAPRAVDVWLPPGFAPGQGHAVLYMHDGQMLFDPAITWNGQSWQMAQTASALIAQRRVRPFIVVAIWNTPARFAEYFPQRILDHLPDGPARFALFDVALKSQPLANAYLRFIVNALKPLIDKRYQPATDAANTVIAGASMGGLISMYALTEYPRVFGGAACVSTHWIGGVGHDQAIADASVAYLRQRLPAPGQHRIYMDRGTAELDARYKDAQPMIDAVMRERGFAAPQFVSRVFEGAGHNETAWAARLAEPLVHLLG